MTLEHACRGVAAVCASLMAAGVLAACGADDEAPARRVAATTAVTTATTTVTTAAPAATTAAPAATTPAVSEATPTTTTTTVDPGAEAALRAATTTPGVGDLEAAGAADNIGESCTNPIGRQADPDAVSSVAEDAAAAVATTTTPLDDPATSGETTTSTTALNDTEAAILGDTATTPRTTTPTTTAGSVAAIEQVEIARPFSTSSPWNTPVDTRAVDPNSDGWIRRASRRVAVISGANDEGVDTTQRVAEDLNLYVNTCAWTPAMVSEEGGETVRIVCRQRNCGPVAKEVTSLQVAPGIDPFPEFDGWYSVFDQSAGIGYDMWRARRVGDVISYQFIKRWRLDGPGFSAPASEDPVAAVGARGSGLPLFAGVIQASELRTGRIDHALAISVPGPAQRVFTQPASVTNGVNVISSLPEGARLRLKSDYKPGRLAGGANRRSSEAIITALRTYGAIVVDRSITPTLYARRSKDYGSLLLGNEVQDISLSDLEVVQSGPLLRFPPLATTQEEIAG